MELNYSEHPHRRYNILTGEWVLVSPHRAKRPWLGQVEKAADEVIPQYEPKCYLCPGNERAGGKRNPEYKNTFVFENDFSALHFDTPSEKINKDNLIIAKGEPGICKVVCFSPRHDLTLPEMEEKDIRRVVDVWSEQYLTLGEQNKINYVQIFENKGIIMGCSNPHPHGQIWAQDSIPVEPAKELLQMRKYLEKNRNCMLCDYYKFELKNKERIIYQNSDFLAIVPFWAVWPFEIMILSKRHLKNLPEMTDNEKDSFSLILKNITVRYDNLFNTSFPYSAGLHQSPTDGVEHSEWHFHMHFYPPLLRSATIKKFMVGYEMLANPQRDITPEQSAQRLKELPETHYKLV